MVTAMCPSIIGDAAVSLAEQAAANVVLVVDGNRGSGSGVIVDQSGVIVTNAHVVRGDSATVEARDGARFEGTLLARDDEQDLAAIRIDREGWPVLAWGDALALRPGQLVLAAGHPLGLRDAITLGVVSRPPSISDPRELVAINLTLNRGNSGGPLLDWQGRLVGVNTMVAGPGLGLAIPSHIVRRFLSRHVDPRPHIGIAVQQIERGLIVTDVQPESPAEASGLLPGDVLTRISGIPVLAEFALIDGLIAAGVGAKLELDIERARMPLTVIIPVVARA